MAVADTFTALMETRPYRDRLEKDEAVQHLSRMARSRALDNQVVNVLLDHFDDINIYRELAQAEAGAEYERFLCSIELGCSEPSCSSAA